MFQILGWLWEHDRRYAQRKGEEWHPFQYHLSTEKQNIIIESFQHKIPIMLQDPWFGFFSESCKSHSPYQRVFAYKMLMPATNTDTPRDDMPFHATSLQSRTSQATT